MGGDLKGVALGLGRGGIQGWMKSFYGGLSLDSGSER